MENQDKIDVPLSPDSPATEQFSPPLGEDAKYNLTFSGSMELLQNDPQNEIFTENDGIFLEFCRLNCDPDDKSLQKRLNIKDEFPPVSPIQEQSGSSRLSRKGSLEKRGIPRTRISSGDSWRNLKVDCSRVPTIESAPSSSVLSSAGTLPRSYFPDISLISDSSSDEDAGANIVFEARSSPEDTKNGFDTAVDPNEDGDDDKSDHDRISEPVLVGSGEKFLANQLRVRRLIRRIFPLHKEHNQENLASPNTIRYKFYDDEDEDEDEDDDTNDEPEDSPGSQANNLEKHDS